jgi:hypothetical protein
MKHTESGTQQKLNKIFESPEQKDPQCLFSKSFNIRSIPLAAVLSEVYCTFHVCT